MHRKLLFIRKNYYHQVFQKYIHNAKFGLHNLIPDFRTYDRDRPFCRFSYRSFIASRLICSNVSIWLAFSSFMSSSNLSALFERPDKQKGRRSLVRENQQSGAHSFVKDFSSIFLKLCHNQPLKKGAGCKNYLEYGKTEVQILFKPLLYAISSMEFSKNFGDKKLPNPLRWLAFLPFHL